jgi:hypothetical protein
MSAYREILLSVDRGGLDAGAAGAGGAGQGDGVQSAELDLDASPG